MIHAFLFIRTLFIRTSASELAKKNILKTCRASDLKIRIIFFKKLVKLDEKPKMIDIWIMIFKIIIHYSIDINLTFYFM